MTDMGPEADFEYAAEMDDEMLAEEREMLEDPAPYEAEVAEDPYLAEVGLEDSEALEATNEGNFEADFQAEENTDEALTGDGVTAPDYKMASGDFDFG